MTARELLAPLAARLRATLADEKSGYRSAGLHGAGRACCCWRSRPGCPRTAARKRRASRHDRQHRRLCRRAGRPACNAYLPCGGCGQDCLSWSRWNPASESIYATDTDSDGSSTHVLLAAAGRTALWRPSRRPSVLGVAVVCEGGGSAAVQSRVTALVQALTGIGTNHITVAKMASAN